MDAQFGAIYQTMIQATGFICISRDEWISKSVETHTDAIDPGSECSFYVGALLPNHAVKDPPSIVVPGGIIATLYLAR